MRQIPLTKGKYALVDDEDYDFLVELPNSSRGSKWRVNNMGYAQLNINNTYILMHRLVADTPTGKDVDHINRDRLDNRQSNLRICTAQENRRNSAINSNNTSGTTGVHYKPARNKWQARITVSYRRISLGYYVNQEDAVNARQLAVSKYFKDFAPIN